MTTPNVPLKDSGRIVEGIQVPETVLDVDVAKIPLRAEEPVKLLKVFKSTMPAMNFITPSGDVITFQQGRVHTDNPNWIQELEKEVANRNPHIYVDPMEVEIASNMVTPMQQLRAKIIAEYLEEQKAMEAGERDMGTSETTKLMPGTSRDIRQAVAGAGPTFLKA